MPETKGRYIYAYCSTFTCGNNSGSVDGVAQIEKRITCHDEYLWFKEKIKEKHRDLIDTVIVINSLSYLGREFEDEK